MFRFFKPIRDITNHLPYILLFFPFFYFSTKLLKTPKLPKSQNCYDPGLTGRFTGNVCQNLSLAIWENVGNVQTYWERLERWQRSRRVKRC